MKKYEPSRQWSVRLEVYMNDHLLKTNGTKLLYCTCNRLEKKRIAKRISMIRRGRIKVDGFWES